MTIQKGVATTATPRSNKDRWSKVLFLVLIITILQFAYYFGMMANVSSDAVIQDYLHLIGIPTRTPTTSSSPFPRGLDYSQYIPASTEAYVMQNADNLGYNTVGKNYSKGCLIWKNKSLPIYNEMQAFRSELKAYEAAVANFSRVEDLRLRLDDENEDVCKSVELHPDGLKGLFPSGQLSMSSSGYVEPILPPLRHPEHCFERGHLLDLGFLIHDFGAMCRKLKKTSRIVLVDMGAALDFREEENHPGIYLISLFRKFGFPFDHVYAFEKRGKKPEEVFDKVPDFLMSSYHWINVGVSAEPEHKLNPLKIILDKFNEDDIIIIKLDIDTPSIELPLAEQILQDDRMGKLIDQFYFEHHVRLAELGGNWGANVKGNVKDSLELFHNMRKKGVPAHSWV